MGWHNQGSPLYVVLPSTSYINYSVLRKACPFSVPLLAMVNSTWSWLLSAIRMTPARPVIRVIPLSYTYSGLLRTYGHGSECLIDGPWRDILLSSLSDGCLAQCHGMPSFLVTDLVYISGIKCPHSVMSVVPISLLDACTSPDHHNTDYPFSPSVALFLTLFQLLFIRS